MLWQQSKFYKNLKYSEIHISVKNKLEETSSTLDQRNSRREPVLDFEE